jgi:hypothetical protein
MMAKVRKIQKEDFDILLESKDRKELKKALNKKCQLR